MCFAQFLKIYLRGGGRDREIHWLIPQMAAQPGMGQAGAKSFIQISYECREPVLDISAFLGMLARSWIASGADEIQTSISRILAQQVAALLTVPQHLHQCS